jgi:diguanylate cyclase (GGDEF)-like protein
MKLIRWKRRRSAFRDPTTGLLQQREMVKHLAETASPRGLLVFDVDDFREFNDSHNLQVGNAMLREVGHRLCQAIPDGFATRLYGDNFAFSIPMTSADQLSPRAQSIRMEVNSITLDANGTQLSVTVSLGCFFFRPGDDPEEALRQAAPGEGRSGPGGGPPVPTHPK